MAESRLIPGKEGDNVSTSSRLSALIKESGRVGQSGLTVHLCPSQTPYLRQEWLEDKDRTAMWSVELNGETEIKKKKKNISIEKRCENSRGAQELRRSRRTSGKVKDFLKSFVPTEDNLPAPQDAYIIIPMTRGPFLPFCFSFSVSRSCILVLWITHGLCKWQKDCFFDVLSSKKS